VAGRLINHWVSRAAFVAALLFLLWPTPNRAASVQLTARENAFLSSINRVRAEHGLAQVTVDVRLVNAARGHSTDMVRTKTFAHGTFGQRAEAEGVTSGIVGETLGWAAHIDTATERIIQMWLASPEHRAILLGRSYRTVGIGISIGAFKGWRRALVVTADYHAPAD
jgi:uncharacterized protein YkwD